MELNKHSGTYMWYMCSCRSEPQQLDKCTTVSWIVVPSMLMEICGNYRPKWKSFIEMRKVVSNRGILGFSVWHNIMFMGPLC